MLKATGSLSLLPVLAMVLSSCGTSGGTSGDVPVSAGPAMIVKGSTPTQLYTHIARQVRSCWLNPRDPVLTKHVFRGEAGAGGASGAETSIVIHEQTRDLKRGLKTFSINFTPIRGGTRVEAQNHKLPYALGQKLVADVGFWAQGGPNCDGPAPAVGTALRGSISGQRVSR